MLFRSKQTVHTRVGRDGLFPQILEDFTADRVLRFLRHLEEGRHNHARTRNQRLAAVHTFFQYVASRVPEMLDRCERSARRAPP